MASHFTLPLRNPIIQRLVPKSTSVFTTRVRTYIARAPPRPAHQNHHPRQNTTRFYATVVLQDQPRSRFPRIVRSILLGLTSFVVGGYLALSYAPPFLTALTMGSMPTNEDTLKYEAPDAWTQEIDDHIKNCAIAKKLRADTEQWTEARPHLKIPAEVRQHNLTAGTLTGPDMIAVPPYIFNTRNGSHMVCIFYVGTHVSGHPGIVHGGFLATMLDEGLARCAFQAMPNKIGVTASLNIQYKRPTMASQFLVLVAKTTKVEGRKAWSEGWIEPLEELELRDKDGKDIMAPEKPLVSAEALFIEPKHAKILTSLYRQAT